VWWLTGLGGDHGAWVLLALWHPAWIQDVCSVCIDAMTLKADEPARCLPPQVSTGLREELAKLQASMKAAQEEHRKMGSDLDNKLRVAQVSSGSWHRGQAPAPQLYTSAVADAGGCSCVSPPFTSSLHALP
jgi:hypothetical protein